MSEHDRCVDCNSVVAPSLSRRHSAESSASSSSLSLAGMTLCNDTTPLVAKAGRTTWLQNSTQHHSEAPGQMAVTPTPQKATKSSSMNIPDVAAATVTTPCMKKNNRKSARQKKKSFCFKVPSTSCNSLPPLSENLKRTLGGSAKSSKPPAMKFSINEECTSLKFSPSGRLLIGGFADGTVRLFDMAGQFNKTSKANRPRHSITGGSSVMVDSKDFQTYGAVAGQIHAKGVHTSLLLTVDVSEDCHWCFAGVLRGSMELLALDMTRLEEEYDRLVSENEASSASNMLDLIKVHRYSDAKLRGFDSCIRKRNSPSYLLFTGKAIKNIHIWEFTPMGDSDPTLVQLYDTQTNGNTIQFLQFRRRDNSLQALSKSDGQKLRIWDLSGEEAKKGSDKKKAAADRPNRPPYTDVSNSESAVGVAGGLCLCGGSDLYNQMSIVSLDNASAFNHSELNLPGTTSATMQRRRPRGDLKCLEAAIGTGFDSEIVLLLLSDLSIWKYNPRQPTDSPDSDILEDTDTMQSSPQTLHNQHAAFGILPQGVHRCIGVGRVAQQGLALAAAAVYSASKNKGRLVVVPLEDNYADRIDRQGYWGFRQQSEVDLGKSSSQSVESIPRQTKGKNDGQPSGSLPPLSESMITISPTENIPARTPLSDSSAALANKTAAFGEEESLVRRLDQESKGPTAKKQRNSEKVRELSSTCKSSPTEQKPPEPNQKKRKMKIASDAPSKLSKSGNGDVLAAKATVIQKGSQALENACEPSSAKTATKSKKRAVPTNSAVVSSSKSQERSASKKIKPLPDVSIPSFRANVVSAPAKLPRAEETTEKNGSTRDVEEKASSQQNKCVEQGKSSTNPSPNVPEFAPSKEKPISSSPIQSPKSDPVSTPPKAVQTKDVIENGLRHDIEAIDNLLSLSVTPSPSSSAKRGGMEPGGVLLDGSSLSTNQSPLKSPESTSHSIMETNMQQQSTPDKLPLVEEEEDHDDEWTEWKPPAVVIGTEISFTLATIRKRAAYNRNWARLQPLGSQHLKLINHDTAHLHLCQQLWNAVKWLVSEKEATRSEALASWKSTTQSVLQWQELETGGSLDHSVYGLLCDHYEAAVSCLASSISISSPRPSNKSA